MFSRLGRTKRSISDLKQSSLSPTKARTATSPTKTKNSPTKIGTKMDNSNPPEPSSSSTWSQTPQPAANSNTSALESALSDAEVQFAIVCAKVLADQENPEEYTDVAISLEAFRMAATNLTENQVAAAGTSGTTTGTGTSSASENKTDESEQSETPLTTSTPNLIQLKTTLLETLEKHKLHPKVLGYLSSATGTTNKKPEFTGMQRVTNYLFIGPFQPLLHRGAALTENNITAVLSATQQPPGSLPKHVKRKLCLGVSDAIDEKGLNLDKVVAFVKKEKELNGRCFVHCGAGISRAATCCIACLVELEGLDLMAAFKFVKRVRPFINPNKGFREMLEMRYGAALGSLSFIPRNSGGNGKGGNEGSGSNSGLGNENVGHGSNSGGKSGGKSGGTRGLAKKMALVALASSKKEKVSLENGNEDNVEVNLIDDGSDVAEDEELEQL